MLRTRPDGQPVPSLDYWGRTSPGQCRRPTVEEFAAIHGADPADISAVESFTVAHGISVEESNAASAIVVVTCTAAQMNEAFGITLNRYELPLHVGRDRHLCAGSGHPGPGRVH
ncbi:protease pro-enzyme activation domain-containing protein [Nocardia sp. NPDC101769]|uniref:protease pro-enzyme activation domain-containing protein n=1 Tax=Nocardia sp. NPDC101769 TaxID=3364333 RepID=UPI003825D0F5